MSAEVRGHGVTMVSSGASVEGGHVTIGGHCGLRTGGTLVTPSLHLHQTLVSLWLSITNESHLIVDYGGKKKICLCLCILTELKIIAQRKETKANYITAKVSGE